MTENLIVIKKDTVKRKLGNILGKMLGFYIDFNREIALVWRRVLPKTEEKIPLVDVFVGKASFFLWLSSFIRILLDHPITALTISTLTAAGVAGVFQGRIGEILMYVIFFNLLTAMLQVMGWIDKLQEK